LASTIALASVSAMAVAITGLVGFRAGRAEQKSLALQIQIQESTIAELAEDLTRTRAERDKLAEARANQAPPASTTTAPNARRVPHR
jgi:hypothetical protein